MNPVETARAILAGDLSGVVKPLEWHHHPATNYGVEEWVGSGACDFHALVQKWPDGWQLLGEPTIGTLEKCKAAAQANYVRRIISALGPALTAMAQALVDMSEANQPTHRHKKRGTEYVLICYGRMQAEHWEDKSIKRLRDVSTRTPAPNFRANVDMREVAIYRSVDDGSLWVRPREEFEDGRFEPLPPAPQPKEA